MDAGSSNFRRIALITGASYGIGVELARCFARGGHDLVLVARSADKLDAVAAEIRAAHGVAAHCISADLSRSAAPQEIVDAIGAKSLAIDVLVNNAGFGTHGAFWTNELSDELALLQVNVVSLVHLTRLVLPGMVQRGRGRILNVASTAAFVPGPLMANYYASKSYVLSFSDALSSELKGTGVTVTTLCPGPVPTGFQKRAGITESSFMRVAGVTAEQVAAAGYRATMAGRRVVVPGLMNRLMILASGASPKRLVLAVVRRMNENR